MATVLQWRKFNFFDVKTYMDSSVLADLLTNVRITACSSGRGVIYIGDSNGVIHCINRQMQVSSFNAHESEVKIILSDDSSNFLITVGDGSKGLSTMKIWSLDRLNSQGIPACLRVIQTDPRASSDIGSMADIVVKITSASFLANMSLLAVGFSDGTITLYKNVQRERGSKTVKLSCHLNGTVTNLHLRPSQRATFLFATTESNIYCINYASKDKDAVVELDKGGCTSGCSALSDSKHEYELLVARDDAIYGYTSDSRTSCYVFEGKKLSLSWFRGYFVVVAEEETRSGNRCVMTIYDPVNKLVTLNTEIEGLSGVLNEWGGLYVLTSTPSVLHISEIDLQSKLDLLFKKNQFDVAISIAKMQYCDQEEVAEILKQYGDWLYDKGNSSAAMEQYIKTIPYLEPSYVIRKFLDTQHIEHLTTYLQALHKSGTATSNHTTLMLNCYTRLKDSQKLDDFIAENEVDCDVDVAVKVCRGAGFSDHALTLAAKYNLHQEYISILINDKKDCKAALQYIWTLPRPDAKDCLLQYGSHLMNNNPEEVIDLLAQLCTNPQFNRSCNGQEILVDEDPVIKMTVDSPEDFEHLLMGQSEMALAFYERLMQVRNLSPRLNTSLLSELIHQYSLAPEGQDQSMLEEKIMKLLRSDNVAYDQDHTLLMCAKYNFSAGKLVIWEKAGMYEDLLEWLADHGDYKRIVEVCMRHADHNQQLWASALKLMTQESSITAPDMELLNTVLDKIDELQLLPPLEIADFLTSSPHLTLGQVRNYLQRLIATQKTALSNEVSVFGTQYDQLSQTRENIETLSSDTIYFTNTKCSICRNNLELPTTHFLCRHSYHKHCLESYSENDECPICLPENKKIRRSVALQKQNFCSPALLQEQLDKSPDPFSVIADFIGQGIFAQDVQLPPPSYRGEKTDRSVGHVTNAAVSESRILDAQNVFLNKGPQEVPTLEIYSKDIRRSPTFSNPVSKVQHTGKSPVLSFREHITPSAVRVEKEDSLEASLSTSIQKLSQPKAPVADNPFEEADTGTNPFGEDFENEDIGTNPFDDSYYDSKNPFVETTNDDKNKNLEDQWRPSDRKSDNPFDKPDYDPALNPFEDS